jgi:DNA-binding SARP family transcriptional activator
MGPFEALLDGRVIAGFQSKKVCALLAYLAVEMARPHARETLAGMLWPEVAEGCAHHSLNQALSNLRRILCDPPATPSFLIVAPQTVQFNRNSDHWLDVEEFGRLVEWGIGKLDGGDERRLEQAVALTRGPFLEGFSLADCPAYEEWIMLYRERLHRLTLETMHRLADAHARRGQVEQALHYAWRQLELDPWLEEAHLQAMRCLALAGRRSEALVQYDICRRLLAKDLGVEPAAATTRLYEQIRNG